MEETLPQASQPPDISSAAFDPSSGQPEAPGLVFRQAPPSTNMPPHRAPLGHFNVTNDTNSLSPGWTGSMPRSTRATDDEYSGNKNSLSNMESQTKYDSPPLFSHGGNNRPRTSKVVQFDFEKELRKLDLEHEQRQAYKFESPSKVQQRKVTQYGQRCGLCSFNFGDATLQTWASHMETHRQMIYLRQDEVPLDGLRCGLCSFRTWDAALWQKHVNDHANGY